MLAGVKIPELYPRHDRWAFSTLSSGEIFSGGSRRSQVFCLQVHAHLPVLLSHLGTIVRANSSMPSSIFSVVIFGTQLTLDRNQEYLLCVFLDELPPCQVACENSAGKSYKAFWKAFPIVKVADTLLIKGAVFDRNANPRFVHPSAFVARCKDAVLVARSGG
jgi:hypothetical protein